MITDKPNMSKVQIFKELPLPSVLEKEKGCISHYIYKAVFIAIKLLLDIRLNLVKISEGKRIKTKHKEIPKSTVGNTVIKETDKIKSQIKKYYRKPLIKLRKMDIILKKICVIQ